MKLYSYFRSSAAFRVRIALALKNINYQVIPIHLVKNGGEHKQSDYTAINPQQLVPALDDNGTIITQSITIMEYLEDKYPATPLLPSNAQDRAFVRSLMQLIACDIHPLNNLRVLQYLQNTLSINDNQKNNWYHHWITTGFDAIEQMLANHHQINKPLFCYQNLPTLADCCLIPQVYNAKRFDFDLSKYPNISHIYKHCMTLQAFQEAYPDNQPDAS